MDLVSISAGTSQGGTASVGKVYSGGGTATAVGGPEIVIPLISGISSVAVWTGCALAAAQSSSQEERYSVTRTLRASASASLSSLEKLRSTVGEQRGRARGCVRGRWISALGHRRARGGYRRPGSQSMPVCCGRSSVCVMEGPSRIPERRRSWSGSSSAVAWLRLARRARERLWGWWALVRLEEFIGFVCIYGGGGGSGGGQPWAYVPDVSIQ